MNNSRSKLFRLPVMRLAALFAILTAFLPVTQAKDRKPHTSAAIKIVGTLSFDNKAATDMMIQQKSGKSYLYVQLANAQEVVVVDINKPDRLKIISTIPLAEATRLNISGNAAMMTAASGDLPATKGELVLWDISEPQNPRLVQRFTGVVRVLQDDRHYTYVLNQDGLWVVSDQQKTNNDDSWNPSIYG